jgi:mono/diheme cytochrome c family protein
MKKSQGSFWLAALLLVLPGLPFAVSGSGVPAAPPAGEDPDAALRTRLAKGELLYRIHCASCHGETGRGDGPVTDDLKIRPTDLTRLAVSHGGSFPRERVYSSVDGRREVRGHGLGSMPVWGLTFRVPGSDAPQEQEVEQKILDLLAYLEIIQEKEAEP